MLSPGPSRREERDEAPLCSLVDLLTPPSLDSYECGLDAFSPSPRLPRVGSRGLILPADAIAPTRPCARGFVFG